MKSGASIDPIGGTVSLHDEYVEKINMAVAEDRFDLVNELATEYSNLVR